MLALENQSLKDKVSELEEEAKSARKTHKSLMAQVAQFKEMQAASEKARGDALWLEQQLQLRESEAAEQKALLGQMQRGYENMQAENRIVMEAKESEVREMRRELESVRQES